MSLSEGHTRRHAGSIPAELASGQVRARLAVPETDRSSFEASHHHLRLDSSAASRTSLGPLALPSGAASGPSPGRAPPHVCYLLDGSAGTVPSRVWVFPFPTGSPRVRAISVRSS